MPEPNGRSRPAEMSVLQGPSSPGEAFAWLLEASSDGLTLSTFAEGRVVWANEAAARLTGHEVADMLGRSVVELGLIDAERRGQRVSALMEQPVVEGEGLLHTRSGEDVPVWVITRRVEVDGQACIATVLRDLSGSLKSEAALRRRGAILKAVSFAADRFLQTSWREQIDEVLERLGKAAELSRVYLFENVVQEDDGRARVLRYEWTVAGIEPLSAFPHHLDPTDRGLLEAWEATLARGEMIHTLVRDLPDAERDHFIAESVRSIAAAPVFVGAELWGEMGFDHCTEEREWSGEEIEAMRTAAGILGASIHHEREERDVKDAEARYRALVEQIPAVVYIDALEGPNTTIYISPQTDSMLGLSQHDWMTDPQLLSKHVHPEDRLRWREAVDASDASGDPLVLEYRIVASDDRVVWVHDEAVLVTDAQAGPRFWHGVMFDITERKSAEQALREAFEREREAAARLRMLDEMKNTFLQAVSHELRTPLTSILGSALTLERADLVLSQEDSRDLVSRIASNARKLHRLLGDLLDLDRLARGIVEPNRQPTDIAALAHGVMSESDVLGGRPVEVEAEHVVVSVDAAKVERIVENLLVNAVRHTPEGTAVWLRIAPEGDGVLICVDDAGPGVPEELREKIFEPFHQGNGGRPHAPGVGVGLALVARFAELHGGGAWVEERPGGGASFRVHLPGLPPG